MTWRDDFKKWNNRGLKDTLCPSYVFNKWIFITCMALVVVMGLFIMARHDFDFENKFYFHCPENGGMCSNPFYFQDSVYNYDYPDSYKKLYDCPVDDEFFCNSEFFFPGYTYGEQKSRDVEMYPLFSVSIFLLGFCLNHILFNKKQSEVMK